MMNGKRTIGILAHVDAGKTTLSEAMLFVSGGLRRAGRVDHGDSFLDTNEIERDRGITIFSSQARLTYEDTMLTLLDTPGHVDFSAEMERTLQVLDYAVLVISGTDGVQSHTRTLWKLLAHYQLPTFLFVNKMDLPGADEAALLEGLSRSLSDACVPLSGEDLTAFTEDTLEALAMCSDALLAEYSDTLSLRPKSVTAAIARREVFPVFFGAALHMTNVDLLLQGLCRFTLPYEGRLALQGQPVPSAFAARVFKIGRDAAGSRITWLRITGGSLRVKDSIPGTENEKVDQIRLYSGEKFELTDHAEAGDVCAVTGLSSAMPGDGLGAETGHTRPVLHPVMTCALLLPPTVSAPSFFRQLKALEEEDPTLHLIWDEKSREIRAQIMGNVQTEILARLIRSRFGVEVAFGPAAILYKETILSPVIGIGHFEPLRHYAEVQLLLEPGERGSGITAVSACPVDVLALNWQRLILTHVLEKEHLGVLTGAPVTDIKMTLLTGRAHLKHTEGGDFRQATYRAIRQGLMSAPLALLEPWYHFELELPADALGRAMADLTRMHASFGDPAYDGDRARLEGRVPVSAAASYASELTAYTRGEGSLSLTPDGYDRCVDPEAVLAGSSYEPLADLENTPDSVFCSHGAGVIVPWDQVPSFAHCEIPTARLKEVTGSLEALGLLPSKEELSAAFQAENEWGRRPGAKASSPSGSLEEDAAFMEVYAREFGSPEGEGPASAGKQARPHAPGYKKKGQDYAYPQIRQKHDKQGNPIYPKKDTREEYLIVDGYNIIFQLRELNALAADGIDAARGALLDILSNYQGYTGQKISVVFDAYRTERTPASRSTYINIEVIFTQKGETADAFIEREVHENAGRYRITVATSDALEQLTVLRLGALRMSARMLAEDICRVTGRLLQD